MKPSERVYAILNNTLDELKKQDEQKSKELKNVINSWILDAMLLNLNRRIAVANTYMNTLEYSTKPDDHKKLCDDKLNYLLTELERVNKYKAHMESLKLEKH